MKLTFLGTGTSQGVPVIGCRCEVCRSTDKRDKRLRTSAMVECRDARIVIDAGPDFRYQMLSTGVRQIDAILLTHFHKDHTGGLDDVRAFNFVDYPTIRPVDIYATESTATVIRKDYDYAFVENKYRGVPEMRLHEIDPSQPFYIKNIEVIPIRGSHSSRFEVTGYRIGRLAYLTDFKQIADEEVEKLKGVECLVVNALRFKPHDSHFSVEEATHLIERVQPQRAYLTHMSHEIGLHAESKGKLPAGVELAYDRLTIEIED
ncbi:MAG: MBL fold metallo-hydrolase [Alistipes sp.]|nr:MBL fold metallo-hydrolase [Alistipes sp.]